MTCSHCAQTDGQVKIGHTTSGSQRYFCKACGHKYTPEPKPQGYEEAVRQQALRLYVDGMNLRRIGRALGISYHSVANWAKASAAQLPEMPPSPEEEVEVGRTQ